MAPSANSISPSSLINLYAWLGPCLALAVAYLVREKKNQVC